MPTSRDAQEGTGRQPGDEPSPASSQPFEAPSVRRREGRAVPHWLLEGIFIVVSVTLGFAIAQYGEHRANRERAARVLAGIEAEMKENLARVQPFVLVHQRWLEALDRIDRSATETSAFDTFFSMRPALPAGAQSSFPILRRSAWDTAVSGDALRLLDYDVVASLSETYRIQEIATANVERRLADGILSSVAVFEPASREASLKLLQFTLRDIAYAEATLVDHYRDHLPSISAAAAASR